MWGALAQAPGVRMQGFDVGGSHKSQQSGYEAFGVQNQARIVTDGVDTTEGIGGAGFYQDYYAQNEISVSARGQDVTMNTPGAAVISTIKSGGNTVQGADNQHLRAGQLRRQQRRRGDTAARRVHRRSRTCCSGKATSISAGRS